MLRTNFNIDKATRRDPSIASPVAIAANGQQGTLVLPDMTSSPYEVVKRFLSFNLVAGNILYVSIGNIGSPSSYDIIIQQAVQFNDNPIEIFSTEPVYVCALDACIVSAVQYIRKDLDSGPNRGILNSGGQGPGGKT